ncbi:MAG: glycosyltransferase [Bacteroidetes bacterium]|nr:glycosyltransferase [Bacteroidota bacterium]
MNISYLLSRFPGSIEIFILREIDALNASGNRVSIISPNPRIRTIHIKNDQRVDSVVRPTGNPVKLLLTTTWALLHGNSVWGRWEHYKMMFYNVGNKSLFRLVGMGFLIDNLVYSMRKNNSVPAHIHSHHLYLTTYVAYQLSKSLGINYSLTLHTLSHLYPQSVLKSILVKATFLRTISTELQPIFNPYVGNPDKFHLITNGIPSDTFQFNPKESSPGSVLKIIATGYLHDKKGFDLLIQACALLKSYNIRFECNIIGSGPEENRLQSLVQNLNLESEIHLLGNMDNESVLRHMSASDVLVAPSRSPKRSTRDGLPTVIIEAMSLSVPVIATDFAGIPDIVKHRETGLLIPQEDYKAITAGIVEFMFDSDLRERVKKNALDLVFREYNLSVNVPLLEELFKNQIDLPNKDADDQ